MLIDRVKKEEAFRSHPYKDSKGLESIGYGFNISPTGPGLSEEESTIILSMRLTKLNGTLTDALPWANSLDPVRFDVLLDMAYNMGIKKLLQFKNTLEMVKVGNYKEAAAAMLQSEWDQEVGQRALNLAKVMESGIENPA